MSAKRVFLIVLDSFGIGELPDARRFGDVGANTLKAVTKSKNFNMPTLARMGLFNIDGVDFIPSFSSPSASFGRCAEASVGKDTTVGHWEICGYISEKPLPTYPDGFPPEIMHEFEKRTGRGWLVNKPYSGTEIIKDYGDEHIKTGKLIIYTSADSVFQIAAHEDVVPVEELYGYCRIAREILQGENAVGRVIARPFSGESGNYFRTGGRHDFSLAPPGTLLDVLKYYGKDVISIGKICDIFSGSGITETNPTAGNKNGMEILDSVVIRDFDGLCFANLVDFDMLYGHRRDLDGYAAALAEFDSWLSGFLKKLRDSDVLVITADHGCDPTYAAHTDHTREYIPLLWYTRGGPAENLKTCGTFADIGKTIEDFFGYKTDLAGESFLSEVTFTPHEFARFIGR